MELFGKYNKYIVAVVMILALVSIVLPLVHIAIHFGATININFGLMDLFNNFGELPQETLDIPMGDGMSGMSEDLILAIGIPLLAYFLNLVFIVLTIPFLFTNKLKLLKISLISIATALMTFAGIRVHALPSLLNPYLEEMLTQEIGGFAALLDLSNLLEINLGASYWLMLSMLLLALVLLVVAKIVEYKKKRISKS